MTMMSLIGANEDQLEIVREMRLEMAKMRLEMNDHLAMTEKRLTMNHNEFLLTKEAYEEKIHDLEREVSFLKDPLMTFECGYSSNSKATSQIISYTKLLYSSTNVEGAGLDISLGVFTSGHPGTYTATWSLSAWNDAGDSRVFIYLRKNGTNIEESQHYTHYTGASGVADDVGGRTLIVHLGRGDTLDLFCDDCSAYVNFITFCVTLSQADVE